MKIKYSNSEEDISNWKLYNFKLSKAFKWENKKANIACGTIIILPSFILAGILDHIAPVLLAFLLGGYIINQTSLPMQWAANYFTLDQSLAINLTYNLQLEITDQGLNEITKYNKETVLFKDIDKIENKSNFTCIYIGSKLKYLIPHHNLAEGNLVDFFNLLKSKLTQSTPA